MALFRKKKEDDTAPDGVDAVEAGSENGSDDGSPPPGGDNASDGFSPEAANKFFEHAETMFETTNYEYSMTLWLQGLAKDPGSMRGHEGFFNASRSFRESGNKKPSKGTVKTIAGQGRISAYLRALLAWGVEPDNASRAVSAVQQAQKFGLAEPALWMGKRALPLAAKEKKPRKLDLLALMKAFSQFEDFQLAATAGDLACKADPSDTKLQAQVRNLQARSTMSRGGFDDMSEGGFRRNIKDADAQRRLEEEGRVVQTEDVKTRQVNAAKADFEANRSDKTLLTRLVDALLSRSEGNDRATALKLLDQAHEKTQEYRFRERADAVRIEDAKVEVRRTARDKEANPDDETANEAHKQAMTTYSKLSMSALESQIEAYPTDLARKFELGRVYFQVKRYEDAIKLFQQAKKDAKRRSMVLNLLAQSFQKIDWQDAAIETFREAIESHGSEDDQTGMELRYGLMVSLQEHADGQSDLEAAEEAYKIASSIAMTDFDYKDVRDRRTAIKEVVDRLKN